MLLDLVSAFRRGVGFGFGLLLLSYIFIAILGFGNARYVGRPVRTDGGGPTFVPSSGATLPP
jgi:hypothetical protein